MKRCLRWLFEGLEVAPLDIQFKAAVSCAAGRNKMVSSQQQSVKVLNKGPGRKRFVFKTFSERLEDVDVDVFQSLHPVKFEPTQGSSFFHENLLQWRELNSAEDFISLYVELMPVVQTLPQLLLHKEMIVEKLLSRVHFQARLSLEPILSLIAVLSRDLQEEFVPFLHQIMETSVNLLRSGGDREPEILEQVFTAISYIMKYIQKFLVNDIAYVTKITKALRYYNREYVQEFAAEAMSFLLRNASVKQLIKGIRKIIREAVIEPSLEKTTGCIALLWHVLKGPASRFHSRAEQILRLLLDKSTHSLATKRCHGVNVVIEIMAGTCRRLCEELPQEELGLLWDCLLDEIFSLLPKTKVDDIYEARAEFLIPHSKINIPLSDMHSDLPSECTIVESGDNEEKEDLLHLSRVLSLLNVVLEFRNGRKVRDYKPLFVLAEQLVKLIWCCLSNEDSMSLVTSEIHHFLLGLVNNHTHVDGASVGPVAIQNVSAQWALVFENRDPCLLTFIRSLISKELCVLHPFGPYIISALDRFIELSAADVLALLVTYFEKLQSHPQYMHNIGGKDGKNISNISSFIVQIIESGINKMKSRKEDDDTVSPMDTLALQPAIVWGALNCYPYISSSEENSSLVWDYALSVDHFLTTETVDTEEDYRKMWQCMIGAALTSHLKVLKNFRSRLSHHLNDYLRFARRYKSSSHVLRAVADFLDAIFEGAEGSYNHKECDSELKIDKSLVALSLFADNLGVADKTLRFSTLRLLSHYEPLPVPEFERAEWPEKRRKVEGGKFSGGISEPHSDVIQQLLSIEGIPLSLQTSRQTIILISKIQMDLCAGKIPDSYLTLLLNGMIGVLHNRLAILWDAAKECLAALLERHGNLVWDAFVHHLEISQSLFLPLPEHRCKLKSTCFGGSKGLQDQFGRFMDHNSEGTAIGTVVTLLIHIVQKVPKLAETRSHQLIPLFLTFIGYSTQDITSVKDYDENVCKGKEWKSILKEWLILLQNIRCSRAFFKGHLVKEILAKRFLEDTDSDVQLKVIDCLLNWKDAFLISYKEHVKNLICLKNTREELTTWSLSKESREVEECHREALIPLIITILAPKVKKIKAVSSRKSAGVVQRKAVLYFLAQLEVNELAPLFTFLLKPLQGAFIEEHNSISESKFCWEDVIERGATLDFINWISAKRVAALPYKKKSGFLHVMIDVLETFDEKHMIPYLGPLLAFVLRILESCATGLECQKDSLCCLVGDPEMMEQNQFGTEISAEQNQVTSAVLEKSEAIDCLVKDEDNVKMLETSLGLSESDVGSVQINNVIVKSEFLVEQSSQVTSEMKELRSLCLKVIATILNKYHYFDFGSAFWTIFFAAVKPLVDRLGQESGSSKEPSALFNCFLAMSKSLKLVLFLQREKSLVPNILSILSMKGLSEAMVYAVLSFVENLLNLDNGNNEELNKMAVQVLLPYLDILFANMKVLVQRRQEHQRKRSICPAKRELRIFKLLGKYAMQSNVVNQFVDALLPFLDAKEVECLEILFTIQEVLPALDGGCIIKMLNAFASLLTVATSDIRSAISSILKWLATREPSLVLLAKLIGDLNALSSVTIGEYDYDTRLNAYEQIIPSLYSCMAEEHALLVLSHFVYDMSSEDLSLRHSATNCLLSFIQFSASVLDSEGERQQEDKQDDLQTENKVEHTETLASQMEEGASNSCMIKDEGSWSKVSIKRVIQKFFLLHMRNAMMRSEASIQREWMALLRAMVIGLSGISTLTECKPLSSTDVEVDFFNNILHIQKHRRARAMARFRNVVVAGHLSEETLMRIFVPLFFSLLLTSKDDKESHVATSCLETIGCISGRIGWNSYFSLLMRSFRLMASKQENNKIIVRLICHILDKFHFTDDISLKLEPNNPNVQTELSETVSGGLNVEFEKNCAVNRAISAEIQGRLQKRVLPEINKLMISAIDMANVSVSLAAVKLLKLIPEKAMEAELPRVIQNIANLLKSRSGNVRDEARTALAACAKELGSRYLQFIIKVLQTTLTRGYELHVLGYTVNFILSKVTSSLDIGDIDYCVEQLLAVAENDIMGEVAEEKEVDKIAFKMKETRNSKSFQSLQIIAESITFRTHASVFLAFMKRNLHKTLAPKVKVKFESMLRYIATGLHANMSLNQTDLFVFVYGLVEDGMEEENMGIKFATFDKSPQCSGRSENYYKCPSKGPADENPAEVPNMYLITVFALKLLHYYLKRVKINKSNQQLLSMLDPFMELLQGCLKSKYEGVIINSEKCLAHLLKLPLPSISVLGDSITSEVFNMVQTSGKSNSPLMQSSLNLLIALLRHAKTTVSKDQLHMLLQFPVFIDLDSNPNTVALSLLKAIVGRKLLVVELYDLITRIAHLIVTTQVLPIRQKCSKILLQFLLDYPLGAKRLQQHLDFLVSNLSYECTSGREAVIEMLHAIILKFPANVVDEQADTFFLPLVACLVNDSDNNIRAMVGLVLKVLIGRISQRPLQHILEYSLSWYRGEKQVLWRPAAQILGLLIEVMKKSFQMHIKDILPISTNILKCAVVAASEGKSEDNEDKTLAFWPEAYYSLTMLEKLLHQFPEASLQKDFEEIWDLICPLLVHPHLWLRNISGRLVAVYFTTITSKTIAGKQTNLARVKSALLLQPSRLFLLAASLCHQLETELLDDSMQNSVVQNLVYVTCALHSFAKNRQEKDLSDFWLALETCDQMLISKGFSLFGSKACRKGCFSLDNRQIINVSDFVDSQDCQQDLETLLLTPIFRKLGQLALKVQDAQAKAILRWYKAIATQIGHDGIRGYAASMLLPLYKITEGFAGKVIAGDLKQLAEEVLSQMKDIMGVENFVQAYNSVRQKVRETRVKRKQTEKIAAIVNPMHHAQRKRKLTGKRQTQKKRKLVKAKILRG